MTQHDSLIVVRHQASALIRAEVRAGSERKQLELAVWDAIHKLGRSVDSVSEASGLTPDEVRGIAAQPKDLGLDALLGTR